jgi:hypothetical protein
LICGFEHRVLRVPSGSRGPVCSPVEPLQPEGLAMAFTEVRTQRPVDRAAARIGGAGGPEDGVCQKVVVSAAWYKRERSYRAAGTAGELQRSHHEQRACRRQRGKVRELRNAVLPRTEKIIVQRERRVKAGGRAGVDADRFHAYAALPARPKQTSTPRSTSVRPIASETRISEICIPHPFSYL